MNGLHPVFQFQVGIHVKVAQVVGDQGHAQRHGMRGDEFVQRVAFAVFVRGPEQAVAVRRIGVKIVNYNVRAKLFKGAACR
jgi:hypothetical protein